MYSERIVIFIDILGFKEIVNTKSFQEVNAVYDEFTKIITNAKRYLSGRLAMMDRDKVLEEQGPKGMIELDPKFVELIFFSDSVIWTYPTDKLPKKEFAIVLLHLCGALNVLESVIFSKGIAIRGGVAIGEIFTNPNKVFGRALVRAVELERLAIYPRVVFDSGIIEGRIKPELYKAFLKHKLCYNLKHKFYAHNYFAHFQILNQSSGMDDIKEMVWDTMAIPVKYLVRKEANNLDPSVRMKIDWLKAKYEQYGSI